MKTYLINDNCVYNEGKYELRTASNSKVIKMTAMRAKCLSFIIENADMDIIERQKITTELWGSRSHFVNDANLTQILYLIRRDLKSLGINDLFITIPRTLRGKQGEEVLVKALNCSQGAYYLDITEKNRQNEEFIFGWMKARVK